MSRFQVSIPEVHNSVWEVDAEDEEEAIEKAMNNDGDLALVEYSHTLERWSGGFDRYEVQELSGSDDGSR